VRMQMVAPGDHPDFLDLPWGLPLEGWTSDRLVEVPRGIARHVVRFVNYDGDLFALKELPERLAWREYRLLRQLGHRGVPVVGVIGVVVDRSPTSDLDAILITRHLEFSLPYRKLFTGRGVPDLRNKLLDALAQLLVRLHVVGFFWGDCSLSNTLFRRDAERLAAYLVDAETGELHPELTEGQRRHDLEIARENIAGELIDVEAGYGLPEGIDPVETADEVLQRYEQLWWEITREEVFSLDERYRIDSRLQRLNELGFDVEEMELLAGDDGLRLRVQPKVVERGQQRQRLLMLTGLDVRENQGRRLLNDIAGYRCHIEQVEGRGLPEAVVAYRWLTEVFEPAIAAIPDGLRGKLEPAQIYHEVLEHRWFLSEARGRDVGMSDAVRSYIANVLEPAPSERSVLPTDTGPMPAIDLEDVR
jgi:Domain of unknown function (DUF4032)/Lipopolysaccharide kinase (Kdo/WaaP) family